MPTAITIASWGTINTGAYRGFALSPSLVSGTITLSGTYTGSAPATVEARVLRDSDDAVIVNWTTLTSLVISGGNWSGNILAPPNPSTSFSAYYIEVRDGANTVSATGTELCAVGLCIACYGQSNMENMTDKSGPGDTGDAATAFYLGNVMSGAGNKWERTSTGSSPNNRVVARFFNRLATLTGIACFGVHAAQPATDVIGLGEGANTVTPDDDPFGRLKIQTTAIGGINGIIYYQGEGNIVGQFATPTRTYMNALIDGIHTPLVTYLGLTTADVPFVLCSLAPYVSANFSSLRWDERYAIIQDTLLRCNDYSPYVHFSHSNYDFTMASPSDGLHIGSADGNEVCERFAKSMAYHLGYVAAPAAWHIVSAQQAGPTTTRVTLAHSLGTDFTPTSGITGFEISDNNGATWVACTGARASSTQILLTHASIGPTRKLRYHYGEQPDISGVVKDNSSITVPLTYTGKEHINVAVFAGTRKPQPTWLENFPFATIADFPSSSLYEIPDMYIGEGSDDRVVFISATGAHDSNTITGFTIIKSGESNITGVVDHTAAGAGGIMHAVVPASYGKFVTARIQFSGNLFSSPRFALYSVKPSEMSSLTKVDGDSSTSASASTRSVSLSTEKNGFMLAAGFMHGNDGSPNSGFSGTESWATNRERELLDPSSYNTFAFGTAVSTSDSTNSNTVTVTFDSAADDIAIVAASFRGNSDGPFRYRLTAS